MNGADNNYPRMIDGFKKHIHWMAETVHQAYHQDQPKTWRECPRDICSSTVRFMEEIYER